MERKTERAWIEVNTGNLCHNVETLKKAMQPGCELMAVVKAQAYWHGAVLTASYLNQMGVSAFCRCHGGGRHRFERSRHPWGNTDTWVYGREACRGIEGV